MKKLLPVLLLLFLIPSATMAQVFRSYQLLSPLGAGVVYGLGTGASTLRAIATSTITAGTGISFTGTPGALVGGTALTINSTGGTVSSGTTGQFPYYAAGGTTLTATSNIFNDTTNNIGIGTTTPWAKLSVNPNGIGSGVPEFVIGSSSATHLIVTGAGNVGVGTAVPGASTKLQVAGMGLFTGGTPDPNDGTPAGVEVGYNTSSNYGFIQSVQTGVGYKPLSLETLGGNVGIGIAAPSYKLDVAGFINTDQYSGYKQAGNTILYASTTNTSTLVGYQAGIAALTNSSLTNTTAVGYLALSSASLTGSGNTAVGLLALQNATTGNQNTAFGALAGYSVTTGINNVFGGYQAGSNATSTSNNVGIGNNALSGVTTNYSGNNNTAVGNAAFNRISTGNFNVAIGSTAGNVNTTGSSNNFIGYEAGYSNISGSHNSFIGMDAGYSNVTGAANIGIGTQAIRNNNSSTSTTAVGHQAGYGIGGTYSNQGGAYFGFNAGYSLQTGSNYNSLFGYQSGYGITTGARNVFLGNSTVAASQNQVTTGSNNISIGNDVAVFDATASNQLNIGNTIYGTGLSGTGATVSSAALIGIGTTTPWAKLSVNPNALAAGTPFFVVGSSTATNFIVDAVGRVGIASTSLSALFTIGAPTAARSGFNLGYGVAPTTPVFGDIWGEVSTLFFTWYDGVRHYFSSNVYTSLADATVNTTGDLSIFNSTNSTGYVGTTTIPANYPKVGKKFHISGWGVYSTPLANTSTVTIKIKYGATTVATVTTAALPASASNLPARFDADCTFRATGVSGSIICNGAFAYDTALTGVVETQNALISNAVTVDTTAQSNIDVTGAWSAVTTQSATIQQASIDFKN